MSKRWYKVTGVGILTVLIILIAVVYWLPKGQTAGESVGGPKAQVTAKKPAEQTPEMASQSQEGTAVEVSPKRASEPKVRKSRSLRRPRSRRPEPIMLDDSRRELQDSS